MCAAVRGPPQERQKTLPISKTAARIHVAGEERRRHRQPVRRLDDRLAGEERPGHHRGHDDPDRHPRSSWPVDAGELLGGRLGSRGRRHRHRGGGRDAVRRRRRRSRRPEPLRRGRRDRDPGEGSRDAGRGGSPVGAPDDHRRCAAALRCVRRGLASRHRRPGRRRCSLRRLQAHRQAVVHVAEVDGADSVVTAAMPATIRSSSSVSASRIRSRPRVARLAYHRGTPDISEARP